MPSDATNKSKRSILITGCSTGGLGAALAEAFHETTRWNVIASARDLQKLEGLRGMNASKAPSRTAGGEAVEDLDPNDNWDNDGIDQLRLDVCDEESIKQAVETVQLKCGDEGLDALCLNAGGGLSMPISDLTPASLTHLFHLNVTSQIAVLNAFLPLLLAARSHLQAINRRPTVIIHTSINAHPYANLPFNGAYSASKAALSHLAQCARLELGMLDVEVLEMRTGGVRSEFYGNLMQGDGNGVMRPRLPVGSLWGVDGVEEVVEAIMDGSALGGGFETDRGQWAKGVVRKIESGEKIIYSGANANNVKWSGRLIPQAIFEWIMQRFFGIQHLPRLLVEAGLGKDSRS